MEKSRLSVIGSYAIGTFGSLIIFAAMIWLQNLKLQDNSKQKELADNQSSRSLSQASQTNFVRESIDKKSKFDRELRDIILTMQAEKSLDSQVDPTEIRGEMSTRQLLDDVLPGKICSSESPDNSCSIFGYDNKVPLFTLNLEGNKYSSTLTTNKGPVVAR